jgi:hypothetical protein
MNVPLQTIAAARVSSIKLLEEGNNSTINADQLHEVLDTISPNDVIILSVPPLVAQDIWKAALPAVNICILSLQFCLSVDVSLSKYPLCYIYHC